MSKVSDPAYHKPNDADQAFLNVYYRFRFYGLPYKYNFNLVMVSPLPLDSPVKRNVNTSKYQYHRTHWDALWDEAILIHFTMRKPRSNPAEHCHKGCNEWEPLEVCEYLSIFCVNVVLIMAVVWYAIQGDAFILRLGEADTVIRLGVWTTTVTIDDSHINHQTTSNSVGFQSQKLCFGW